MRNIIDVPKMIIVSPFGPRVRDGKEEFHWGVDLRSWNLISWRRLLVVAHEPMEVLRIWKDGWGTGFSVRPMTTAYDEFKYIHIEPTANVKKGALLNPGDHLGVSQAVPIKKWQEHIHFEVVKTGEKIDPVSLFQTCAMNFEVKK